MNIRFDDDQKKAIKVEKNAVISAGAGSGKTTVLAERFCYLIENCKAGINEILALTFTQKAKTEMYEKIYERLSASDNENAKAAVSGIDTAVISTLDGFCSEIARNWTSHFGIPSNFMYTDSEDMAIRASLDFMLENANNPALKKFIRINGFDAVLNRFFADFAVRHVRIAMRTDFSRYFDMQMEHLSAELELRINRLCAGFDDIRRLPPDTESVRMKQKLLSEIPDLLHICNEERFDSLVDELGKIDTSKPKGKAGETVTMMKEIIDTLKEEIAILDSIARTLAEKDLVGDLFSLLTDFCEYYIAKKREKASLDYGDVAHLALVTLAENESVRRYYKKKFKYIIIDEFQDNNGLQKNLLYYLAEKQHLFSADVPEPGDLEPGKLFFVGDEKQSIYRFRDADVSVFRTLGDELAGQGGEDLALRTNYRSEKGLIDFFNGFFASLMSDAKEPYEARFAGLLPGRSENRIEPAITFLYKPYSETESGFSSDESEAFAVAQFVSDAVRGSRLPIVKDGCTVTAGFDDFAVLMRSTSNQTIYERMFRLFDVPFVTQGARSLFLEAPIYDLYSLLRTACFPGDRVAYAALLRSPLVNVSDSALVRVLASGNEPFAQTDVLDEDDKRKFDAGRRMRDFVARNADKLQLSELVDYFWYECGYRLCVLRDGRFPNLLEYYDYTVAMARRFDKRGSMLSEFLDFLSDNLGKYEKLDDIDILKYGQSGVKLLSIHKSKGLEFPVVILANTGNVGRHAGSDAAQPYYLSGRFGPTFNMGERNYFFTIGSVEEEKEQVAELKRLLYVACTRAEFHLVVSGAHNRQNRGSAKAHLNMIVRCLGLGEEIRAGVFSTQYGSRVDVKIIDDLTPETYMKRVRRFTPADVSRMAPFYDRSETIDFHFPRIEFRVTDLNEAYGASAPPGRAEDQPGLAIDPLLADAALESLFGTLCHEVLRMRITTQSCSRDDLPQSLIRDIPELLFDSLFDAAYALSGNFFASKLGTALGAATACESEYPFLYRLESGSANYYIDGQVDLYFRSGERGYIVDFKTDKKIDPSKYVFQLAFYRLALEECFGKGISCFIFPLRSGKPVEVIEEVDEKTVLELIERIPEKSN